jgi:hypothetical protein
VVDVTFYIYEIKYCKQDHRSGEKRNMRGRGDVTGAVVELCLAYGDVGDKQFPVRTGSEADCVHHNILCHTPIMLQVISLAV